MSDPLICQGTISRIDDFPEVVLIHAYGSPHWVDGLVFVQETTPERRQEIVVTIGQRIREVGRLRAALKRWERTDDAKRNPWQVEAPAAS